MERVITITGPAINKKGNYRIPIGTPLRFALESVGVAENISQVFMGGPMMGQAISDLDIPITKGASGFVAFTERQTGHHQQAVYSCIHCGHCMDVCPMCLNPSQLGLLAKNETYDVMAENYHLMDCFECGACSYVCPSHIPLVQYFRIAKSYIAKTARQKITTKL
jgi:electron transport complex protein RnfC